MEMCCHYAGNAFMDKLEKRIQIRLKQYFLRSIYNRQIEMRIRFCISVTGKVLGGSDNFLGIYSLVKSDSLLADIVLISTERTKINNRFFRIAVDIHYRCIIDMDSQASTMPAQFLTHFFNPFHIVFNGTQSDSIRKLYCAVQPH